MSLKGMEFDSFAHPPKKWSNYGLAMHFVIKLGWGSPANGLAAFSSSPVLLFMTETWKSRPLNYFTFLWSGGVQGVRALRAAGPSAGSEGDRVVPEGDQACQHACRKRGEGFACLLGAAMQSIMGVCVCARARDR